MFATLDIGLKKLGEVDPHDLGDEELSDALLELERHRRRLEAEEARLAAAWDARRVWAADGAKSGAAWLARRTHSPRAESGGLLWLGRHAAQMPLVAAGWAAGDIGAAHVRRLDGVRNNRTLEAFTRDEVFLVHSAAEMTFFQFCRMLDYWLLHADPDGACESDMAKRERRRVSLDETFTGMYSGSMLMTR